MATIAEQLTSLANTKTAIKDAIVAKGVTVADDTPFSGYAAKIGEISGGGGAPATKFGVSIDDLIGDVDERGYYSKPTAPVLLDLSGVKMASPHSFAYLFLNSLSKEIVLLANDLVYVGVSSFERLASTGNRIDKFVARFDSLVEITSQYGFQSFGPADAKEYDVKFSSLEYIKGDSVFANAFDGLLTTIGAIDLDSVFPKLRHIGGNAALKSVVRSTSSSFVNITLSSVETIIGGTAYYSATFYGVYTNLYLPKCTRVENYIFDTSNKCTVHFAAANQAAIEACPGYDKMFGASGIYFDL